jgi:hypothetical protein
MPVDEPAQPDELLDGVARGGSPALTETNDEYQQLAR